MSLGFFDDILIPPEALQHPSHFDENDQVQIKLVKNIVMVVRFLGLDKVQLESEI